METKCLACGREFQHGEAVVAFCYEQAQKGTKSGLIGFYSHPHYGREDEGNNNYTEHVHFTHSCLEKCFSPADNPYYYDQVVQAIRKEVEADIRDEIYDELSAEYDDMPRVRVEEDPPFCLWCKREDTVWLQERRTGCVFFCTVCQKYWDDQENELDNAAA